MAEKLIDRWKIAAGFPVDVTQEQMTELVESKAIDIKFFIDYALYRKFTEDKVPAYIKGTDEELIINLCKGLNMTPETAVNLKTSFIIIYTLSIEKQNFIQWYGLPKKKPGEK